MADETANESCFVRSLINFPRRAINRPNKYIYIYRPLFPRLPRLFEVGDNGTGDFVIYF